MSKLRKAARGMECQIRIPNCCNFNPETTTLAHYRLAGTCGVAMKPPDLLGAWACEACHSAVDGRTKNVDHEHDLLRLFHAEGVLRTLNELIKRGKL
jgi:Protein of unknown function (DUF1364)